MYQCLRYTAWIKAYASKLALGGFQCSGLSVSNVPELRFHRTRIFSLPRLFIWLGLFAETIVPPNEVSKSRDTWSCK